MLDECAPIAAALDAPERGQAHQAALQVALDRLSEPDQLPSARVLTAMREAHGGSHIAFVAARSEATRQTLVGLPWPAEAEARFEAMATQSVTDQAHTEAMDSLPFEIYRQEYLAPRRLGAALTTS